jgi:UDP-2,3-diacylglucosamine pyrophosphatase LpxH
MSVGDPDINLIGRSGATLLDCVIISDLHLGSEVCQASELERFLDWVVDNAKMLIINGDIFDDLNFKRLKRHHFNCLRIIRRNTDRQDFRIIWMRGNHDGPAGIISHIVGVDILDEYVFDNGKIQLLILHGDQYDAVVSRHPLVTDFFSALFRIISRVLPINLARLIRRLSKKFQRNSVVVKSRAVADARRRGFNAVTCGHTHKAEDAIVNGIRFINTGTWTERTPCPYLWIEGDQMGLKWWPDDRQVQARTDASVNLK